MRDGIIGKARELRERQTKAESLLWSVLRAKQLCGLKFRRQHPIPPYVADFACVARKVVVELDGGYHDYQYQYDVSRQRFLELQGWKVIRFLNEDVLNDVEAVAVSLSNTLGVKAEFQRRKGGISGMLCKRNPLPDASASDLPHERGRGDPRT